MAHSKEISHPYHLKKRPTLDIAKSEFRICRISPGNPEDTIRCTLRTTNLDAAPAYSCLSYVWGSPTEHAAVELNGRTHKVTINLLRALQRLREVDREVTVWIDAICIDQTDDDEKTQQVGLMGRIYREAEEVLVWLGEPEASVVREEEQAGTGAAEEVPTDGLDFLETLELLAEGRHFHELPCFGKCRAPACPSLRSEPEMSFDATLASLKMFMDAVWFERTWTVQEIILAQQATVIFGSHRVPWGLVAEAWSQWNLHLNSCCGECISTLDWNDFENLRRFSGRVIDLINTRVQIRQGHCVLQPLLKYRSKQSSDMRDKIYGLLGLQAGPHALRMRPDYSLSLSQVYICIAKELIMTQGWLVPLQFDLTQELPDLPSWVPDWTVQTDDPPDYCVTRAEMADKYDAAANLDGEVIVTPDDALIVPGKEIGTISRLSTAYHLTNSPMEQLDLIAEWENFTGLRERSAEPYKGGGTIEEAFFSSIFAGRFHEDGVCRELFECDVEAFRDHLKETSRRLRELGPTATLSLSPEMSSHVIAVLRRRLFETEEGWIGVCPDSAVVGDKVLVLCHAPAPVFLRPSGQAHEYRALGHGYVHGLMDGEASQMGLSLTEIVIK